jgi:hypothetical protein
MARTFFPKAHYMPIGDRYRPLYRWYEESNWTMVPNVGTFPTVAQALSAAEDYMKARMNPEIRAEQAKESADPLGVSAWRQERAGRAENDQRATFGSIFKQGREIKVESKKRKALVYG